MIEFEKVKVGDKLRYVGTKSNRFTRSGNVVTVHAISEHGLIVSNDANGLQAGFTRDFGSTLLEPVADEPAS